MAPDALDGLVDDIVTLTNPDGGTVAGQDPDPTPQQDPQPAPQPQLQPEPGQDPVQGGQPTEDDLTPPAHWSDEDKAIFEQQSPEGKAFILRRHRAMEGDYTRKTQLVAEQMKAVAGLQGLAVHLQRDPNFRQHLQSYFTAQAQAQPGQAAGAGTQPEDEEITPVEQLKREAADLAYERIQRENAARAAQTSQVEYQRKMAAILQMKASDELADRVQAKLDKYVDDQPLPWQKESVYKALATNPDVYAQMYAHYRKEVERELQESGGGEDQGAPAASGRRNVVRLERGGGDRRPTMSEAKRKKMNSLKHQTLASGETEALANFLDEAGVIDSLL